MVVIGNSVDLFCAIYLGMVLMTYLSETPAASRPFRYPRDASYNVTVGRLSLFFTFIHLMCIIGSV